MVGMSVCANGIGSMTADVVFVYWNALIFTAIWTLFAPAGHWYMARDSVEYDRVSVDE